MDGPKGRDASPDGRKLAETVVDPRFGPIEQGGQGGSGRLAGLFEVDRCELGYHFLHMQTGRRVWQSELSTIDTTFLLAGMLTAAVYFDREDDRGGGLGEAGPGFGGREDALGVGVHRGRHTEQQHARDEGGKEAREAISRSISRIGGPAGGEPDRPPPEEGAEDRHTALDHSDPVADISSGVMSIIASISGPPVRRKRQTRAAARARKMTLRTEV
jgi:hypothetical protein